MKTADFNTDWLFSLCDDASASRPDFDDGSWPKVDIPHDWSMELGYDKEKGDGATGYVTGGKGWYRKHFSLDSGGCHSLLFDGIYNRSTLWLNGHRLGDQFYGYAPFHFDLTPYLNPPGEENILAVKVDRRRHVDSRWYTGSGIYRKVELCSGPAVHIPVWGSFIRCEEISQQSALIRAGHTIKNIGTTTCRLRGVIEILSSDGTVAASQEAVIEPGPGATLEVDQTISVEAPALWSPESPSLYTARFRLMDTEEEIDSCETVFGIRSIEFHPEKGFYLNGENQKIKGVCLHHDGGLCGSAVPADVWRRRLMKLKEIGCNAIRMAHNPGSSDLLDLCDQMGFMVQDEFFDEWDNPKDKRLNMGDQHDDFLSRGSAEYFRETGEQDLKNTIRSHRNHPCIIQWSIGNEIEWTYPRNAEATGFFGADANGNYFWTLPPYSREKIREQLKTLPPGPYDIGETAQKLARWTREMDTSRPVTANCILPSASFESGYTDALDVVGFSYRRVIYDYAREHYPEKAVMGAENLGQWHEWKAVLDRDFIAGIFVWTGIDYLGESHKKADDQKATESGFLNLAGFKKPSWHMFRSLWKEEPHIKLFTQREALSPFCREQDRPHVVEKEPGAWEQRLWTWHDVNEHWNYTEGEDMIVEAYSNCGAAELFLDGESLGRKALADFEDRIYKWALPYKEGILTVKGIKDGQSVQDTLSTAGSPCCIELKTDRSSGSTAERDCFHITARLLDPMGIPVTQEERTLTFQLKGPGKVLGYDNGSSRNWTNHDINTLETSKGRALMIVQTGDTAGISEITVSGDGLEDSRITIKTI
ncbi:MAG: glycoside hydrolase family 2 TIM barrel-domain containing protein [Spirochaetales bacterium]|nr:glycoside hydrolase family 2 TIM barrel-domain containing protein [Spirochaetales bacterium]